MSPVEIDLNEVQVIFPEAQRLLAAGRGECLLCLCIDASTLEPAQFNDTGQHGTGRIAWSGPITIDEAKEFREMIRRFASKRRGRK